MEMSQLIRYEENLAAYYEAEYLLCSKVNDQGLCESSYDDSSEVSAISGCLPQPPGGKVISNTNTFDLFQNSFLPINQTMDSYHSTSMTNSSVYNDNSQLPHNHHPPQEMCLEHTPSPNTSYSINVNQQFSASSQETNLCLFQSVNASTHSHGPPFRFSESPGTGCTQRAIFDDMECEVYTEQLHLDGPSTKRSCLRQPESDP